MSVVDLAYAEHGRGEPVVLLHAFPLWGVVFDHQLAALSDRYRVIVPDLRGFGASPLGEGEPSLDRMADDVVALLDRLGLDHPAVGGLSMGGYVLMAMLRGHRDRVGGVLLIDTKATPDPPAARENRERVARAVLAEGPAALRPMVEQLLGPTTRASRPEVVRALTGWLDRADPAAVAWAQRAMAARPDSRPTLASISAPAAVLVGEEDPVSPPEEASAMAWTFPRPAAVRVIPGAGHLPTVEVPEVATDAIRAALPELVAG